MAVRTEIELLRAIPLFEGVADSHLQLISFASEPVQFRKGEALLRKGELGTGAFLILTGHANAYAGELPEGLPVTSAPPGSLVGEMAMIAEVAHGASVFAASDISAKKISRFLFQRIAREFPDFGERVLAALSAKLDGSIAELGRLRRLIG